MRSNGLLKWLMIPVALLVVFVGIRLFSGGSKTPAPRTQTAGQLTPDEMKALGIEGDTANDTVATLVAQVKQLRTELQTALTDNKAQRTENERLRQRENAIDQRISTALNSERANLRRDQERLNSDRQQSDGLLQEMQRRLESLSKRDGHADLPVGLGLRDGEGAAGTGAGGTLWIEPDDARSGDKRNSGIGGSGTGTKLNFPTSFGPAQRTLDNTTDAVADPGNRIATGAGNTATAGARPAKAVYTVPTNSTLMGSVAMTALIGRVPVDGTVNDPYPFKVLIGEDNLTANGIEIPDVAGAVVSGTASGDWTLSCVRGQIRSVTFVFHDGTIRTIPEDGNGNQQNSNQQTNNVQNGLGWISDPYGIPCVGGERRSNAQQYLGTQALITAAGAGAASLIKSDSGQMSYVSGSNGSIGTVGISGNEAMGRILAGGVQEMSQWVNKLYGQAFAAVYVEPGAHVAVHLEKPLAIDYAPEGRKVDHRTGEAHASELD
jgi:integrating conjugative element protein (TIGR03752 family)